MLITAKSLYGAVSLANNAALNVHGYQRIDGLYYLRVSQ